jgi:hypothetical protein
MQTAIFLFTLLQGTQSHPVTPPPTGVDIAPVLSGLGYLHFPVSTKNAEAQKFFDQGIKLYYAFNHAEALRSFKTAAYIDKNLAMAYWGAALSLGPNINARMDDSAVPEAYQLVQKAASLMRFGTEREKDFVMALLRRYGEKAGNRDALDEAYYEAMKALAKKYPHDADALTLFAESSMVRHPWNYWNRKTGEARAWTPEILETLEKGLSEFPFHIGLNHYYIHAVEASKNPERGLSAADRLGNIAPNAGHLVHMPSHIYIRAGRYHDASIANQRAVEADDRYFAAVKAQGLYAIGYRPHNWHFLWSTSSLEGRSAIAINAAKQLAKHVDPQLMRSPGLEGMQHFWATPYFAYVRFGKWAEIMKAPEPDKNFLYAKAMWHYARGFAEARTGKVDAAKADLEALNAIASGKGLENATIWDINKIVDVLKIASECLSGEVAAAQRDFDKAVQHLKRAVELEDNLNYDEPPPWYYSVRLSLGAVLLSAGRAKEAEAEYRNDLGEFPANGWALFGLQLALKKQGKDVEAAQVMAQFKEAWKYADVTLVASRF